MYRKWSTQLRFATLHDWLKKLAPLFHPIRSKTKTNRDSLAHFFPRFASASCNYFKFWLVHLGSLCVCVCPSLQFFAHPRRAPSLAHLLARSSCLFLRRVKERKRLLPRLSLSNSAAIPFLRWSSLSICCCPILAKYSAFVVFFNSLAIVCIVNQREKMT